MRWPRPTHPWNVWHGSERTGWAARAGEQTSHWLTETPLRRAACGIALLALGTWIVVRWRVDPEGFWDGRRALGALITAPFVIAVGLYLFVRNAVTWLRGDDLRDDTSLIDPPV